MKVSPDCILVTYQFHVSDVFIDAISKTQDTANRFTNFMSKFNDVVAVTFNKFMGQYVWVSVDNPHGRLIISHEVIHDAIALYADKMV